MSSLSFSSGRLCIWPSLLRDGLAGQSPPMSVLACHTIKRCLAALPLAARRLRTVSRELPRGQLGALLVLLSGSRWLEPLPCVSVRLPVSLSLGPLRASGAGVSLSCPGSGRFAVTPHAGAPPRALSPPWYLCGVKLVTLEVVHTSLKRAHFFGFFFLLVSRLGVFCHLVFQGADSRLGLLWSAGDSF